MKLLSPHHGFKLLDAQNRRVVAGECVDCELAPVGRSDTNPTRQRGEPLARIRCDAIRRGPGFDASVSISRRVATLKDVQKPFEPPWEGGRA